jgi:hypothetical protein
MLPYCHPRLGVQSADATNGTGCGTVKLTLLCIPRGAQYDSASGLIRYEDGVECNPPGFTPMAPTPDVFDALPAPAVDMDDPRPPAPPQPEPLAVLESEPDDGKIESLAAWRRRDE